ncbi:unnamed protein product [Protopolystoma xenopodis]|uniref:Uncharacterized protein n=1 Tax=Protopolystoma xenopodis TaxID=117903 RepID=A0A3S5A5N1_9PLAT|nr:unnamed protein product [Protopolystoma xenopodis]
MAMAFTPEWTEEWPQKRFKTFCRPTGFSRREGFLCKKMRPMVCAEELGLTASEHDRSLFVAASPDSTKSRQNCRQGTY